MSLRKILACALAALLLHLMLVQPNHPAALSWGTFTLFPLELPAILLALLAAGRGWIGRGLTAIIVIALSFIVVLKAADFIMQMALSRGFNPVADLSLVGSLYDLVVGSMGPVIAMAAACGAVLVVVLLVIGQWWACRQWSGFRLPGRFAAAAAIAAFGTASLAVADIGVRMDRWSLPVAYPGTAFTARIGVERVGMVRETLTSLRAFRQAAMNDPFADSPGLFDLVDRDVVVVFIESYGRTSLDTPFYADLHRETLRTAEAELADLGLSTASTLLHSPTQGGQSWLAHSTFANGLWVTDQTSYGAVLNSGRRTLYHLASDAGFHSATVMPQITLDWPEAQFMGFDTVLAAQDLGYAGRPLNWVTMPDQFTFAAMDRLLRADPDRSERLFVQIATGSSHAPWVPVPELVDWDTLGDGSQFDALMDASDPPRVVWSDYDRVRAQYRLAVDYALQTVFSYAARHAAEPPLMLIIGDHQAAGFIALDDRPHVPMHIVGPDHLVSLLADERFADGLIPPSDAVHSMADMRAHILRSLSSTPLARSAQ